MKTRSVVMALCASLLATGAGGALACGYHPGLTSDTFDAVHPRSLAVAVAIHKAQGSGVLPADPPAPTLATFAGNGYRHAVGELRGLQERLAQVAPRLDADGTWRFAFVFVRSRLWAQYTVRPDGASVEVHTPPAAAGETVVLSDESVLNAIVDGQLSFNAAVDQGLVQFADDRSERAQLLLAAAFAGVPPGQ